MIDPRAGTFNRFAIKPFQAIFICYLAVLCFVAVSSPGTTCKVSPWLQREHTCAKRVEPSHVDDCRLTLTNVWSIIDLYVVAHLFGWTVKAIILPHPVLLCCSSVLFEVVELTLVPVIPSLAECWWDSWLLDVFGCNAIGIFIGLHITHYLNSMWKKSPFDLLQCILIIFCVTMTDVNTFMLKHAFSIPVFSPFLALRLVYYISLAFFTVSPYHFSDGIALDPPLSTLYIFSICAELFIITYKTAR